MLLSLLSELLAPFEPPSIFVPLLVVLLLLVFAFPTLVIFHDAFAWLLLLLVSFFDIGRNSCLVLLVVALKLEADLERDCGNGNSIEQIGVEGLDIHICEHLRLELPCLVIFYHLDVLEVYELCILRLLPAQQPFLVRPRIVDVVVIDSIIIICMLVVDSRIYWHFLIFFQQEHPLAVKLASPVLLVPLRTFSVVILMLPSPLPSFSHEQAFPLSPVHLSTAIQLEMAYVGKHVIYEGLCD